MGDPAMVGEWADELRKMSEADQLPPWCSYLARREGVPVGSGGFKGPPDENGAVEIGYLTFLPAQGAGVATEVAAALVAIARRHGIAAVRAHTLREDNASTRVLRANAFELIGDVVDPEDGPVWRWEIRLR